MILTTLGFQVLAIVRLRGVVMLWMEEIWSDSYAVDSIKTLNP